MASQRKTAADYGQLSLFEDAIPDWLQPAEPAARPAVDTACPPEENNGEDDDLGQFMQWLQHNRAPGSDCG